MTRASLMALCAGLLWLASSGWAQEASVAAELVARVDTGEDLAVAAAWSPDGRILAYGTEKRLRERRVTSDEPDFFYPGEVWLRDPDEDKPKRILKHNLLGEQSFRVERLTWSPDGSKLVVELTDDRKNAAAFLFTSEGKRIKLGKGKANFVEGYGAGWLADNETLGLLNEAVNPRLLHSVRVLRITGRRELFLFRGKTFAAVAWFRRSQRAAMVARDREFSEPPELVLGNLDSGELESLGELNEGYLGGLAVSPDETKLSYFVGQERLAVRGLNPEAEVEYWPIPFGRYEWTPSGGVLFVEPRELGRRMGWLTYYDPAQEKKVRLLPEELIHDFWPSPDGQQVAVLTAGLKPELRIYRLPPLGGNP